MEQFSARVQCHWLPTTHLMPLRDARIAVSTGFSRLIAVELDREKCQVYNQTYVNWQPCSNVHVFSVSESNVTPKGRYRGRKGRKACRKGGRKGDRKGGRK